MYRDTSSVDCAPDSMSSNSTMFVLRDFEMNPNIDEKNTIFYCCQIEPEPRDSLLVFEVHKSH